MYKNISFSSLLILFLFPYASSSGNSLFSPQGNLLYVPYLNYQGQNFQAKFSLFNRDKLQLLSAIPRQDSPIYGKSTSLDEDLNFTLQPINSNGHLYSAQISHLEGNTFHIDSIAHMSQNDKRRGSLIDSELVDQITQSQFNFLINLYNAQNSDTIAAVAKYNVQVYTVTYQTIDPSGKLVPTSALIAFPDDIENSHPLIAYQHGTEIFNKFAPSLTPFDVPTIILAASGYVVVTADYLGLRETSLIHPFVHAHSLATSVIDGLRSARLLAAVKGVRLNEQLFLAGYSEGGYATMATHREIQRHYSTEFSVTASAPMAGPFALSDTMLQSVSDDKPLPSPYFIPYALLAYNQVYGYIQNLSDYFQSPYEQTITQLYTGLHTASHINGVLPEKQLLYTPLLYTDIEASSNSWLKAALEENDIYRWKPSASMYLYHCINDDKVPYQNSQIAYDYFQAVGATQVQLFAIDKPLLNQENTHESCAIPLLMKGKALFDSMLL